MHILHVASVNYGNRAAIESIGEIPFVGVLPCNSRSNGLLSAHGVKEFVQFGKWKRLHHEHYASGRPYHKCGDTSLPHSDKKRKSFVLRVA